MYKTVIVDGEEIIINSEEKPKGNIILPDLEKTDDLSDIVNYINDNSVGDENND